MVLSRCEHRLCDWDTAAPSAKPFGSRRYLRTWIRRIRRVISFLPPPYIAEPLKQRAKFLRHHLFALHTDAILWIDVSVLSTLRILLTIHRCSFRDSTYIERSTLAAIPLCAEGISSSPRLSDTCPPLFTPTSNHSSSPQHSHFSTTRQTTPPPNDTATPKQ